MLNRTTAEHEAETDNERRYLALLALTSQELPRKPPANFMWTPAQQAAVANEFFFERLDIDPAALETFVAQELARMKSPKQKSSLRERWSATFTQKRYAVAFGVIAAVAILTVQLTSNSLLENIEQSFATLPSQSTPLILPWEQPRPALGFATTPANESRGAIAFARGLLRGKGKLSGSSVGASAAGALRNYVALGEWNVLLWSACQADSLSLTFWRTQSKIAGDLASASYSSEDRAMIVAHVAKATRLLEPLTRGDNVKRAQRALADELTLFREQFAPHDSKALDKL
jgi:hypothetical protein